MVWRRYTGSMLRFSLASLVKRTQPARRTVNIRTLSPPQALRRNLERRLLLLVRAIWTQCRDRIMPEYQRQLDQAKKRAAAAASGMVMDDANDLATTMASMWSEIDRVVVEMVPDINLWALQVETWQRAAWAQALTPSGVQLGTLMSASDVSDTLAGVVQSNVALVRSISSEARTRLEGIVFRGFQQRLSARDIAKQIASALQMSRARALRIAADQTAKLSAQLDDERFAQAGIEDFEWVHSGKVHFRPWHRARDGKVFKLKGEIPPDDMPGIPPFCGCKKKAVLTL